MPAEKKKDKKKEDAGPVILQGVYMFANGDKYDGDYEKTNDGTLQRSGHGIHITSEGTKFTGNWVEDKMCGQGRLDHPSGAFYEGEFLNNQFNGNGTYTWPNGSYYQGEFAENRMEGDGQFTDTDGQTWTGTFRYKAALGLRFKVAV